MNLETSDRLSTTSWSATASVAAYARRVHAALGRRHVATSPLGAYLLLAMIAPLTTGPERAEIERVLGGSVEETSRWLAELLARPHPAVATAVACWHERRFESDGLSHWMRSLPKAIERGAIPDRAAADRWVRDATNGLIDRLPVAIDPWSALLLVSALTTAVKWDTPFWNYESKRLDDAAWTQGVSLLLWAYCNGNEAIVRTKAAGLVAVQVATSAKGLVVASVIADPQLEPGRVIEAAYEVAAMRLDLPSPATRVSLYDLPLGRGHAWDLVEKTFESRKRNVRRQSAKIVMPAWKMELTKHDLLAEPAWGMRPAVRSLQTVLPASGKGSRIDVKQAVRAAFNTTGFTASAVTAAIMPGAKRGLETEMYRAVERHATIQFSRPFAVVACTSHPKTKDRSPVWNALKPRSARWTGLPVFTAWVTEWAEAEERD